MSVPMKGVAATLDELVAPLPLVEFLSLLRERKLAFLRGVHTGRYGGTLGWHGLRRLFERGEHPRLDHIMLAKESVPLPAERWSSEGRIDVAKLDGYLARGFSLIVTHIEDHVPALGALCADIAARIHESCYAGAIVTEGSGGAFKTHFDPEDLVILQVEGTKRWQIFGPAVPNPVRGMEKPPVPKTEPVFDEILAPGDLLFVPAGHWHHCRNGPERSVHLGIFFTPPTGWHAIRALTSQLLSDEIFRAPLSRLQNPSDLAAIEADIKSRLAERISALKLGDFVRGWTKKD